MKKKYKSKFVNGNRTPQERRVIYCMCRTLFNMTRLEARMVEGFRKSVQIRYIKQTRVPL